MSSRVAAKPSETAIMALSATGSMSKVMRPLGGVSAAAGSSDRSRSADFGGLTGAGAGVVAASAADAGGRVGSTVWGFSAAPWLGGGSVPCAELVEQRAVVNRKPVMMVND